MSDVFHEMAHIFLGVLKANYPDSYQAVIAKY
nr:MAG TPA: SprT-like family protein [Caudoviricetes sp.]